MCASVANHHSVHSLSLSSFFLVAAAYFPVGGFIHPPPPPSINQSISLLYLPALLVQVFQAEKAEEEEDGVEAHGDADVGPDCRGAVERRVRQEGWVGGGFVWGVVGCGETFVLRMVVWGSWVGWGKGGRGIYTHTHVYIYT